MDDAVLDEVLGRGASDRPAGLACRSAASRSTATSDSPLPQPLGPGVVRDPRRALRAALDARRRARSASCRRWAGCTTGHRALMASARAADDATTVVTIFVNPRQFNVAADFTRYPRNEARDLAICEAEGVDLVFAPTASRGLPARLRHRRLGRRDRASRSRAPPGPATSTASPRSSRSCSASSAPSVPTSARRTPSRSWSSARWRATSPSRPRSSPARPSASRTASRCRRATSTSRPAERAAAPVLQRALLAAAPALGGAASDRATRSATRCAASSPREPLADVDYVSVADGGDARRARPRRRARRSCRWRSGSGRRASSTTSRWASAPRRPEPTIRGRRSPDPPRLPRLLRARSARPTRTCRSSTATSASDLEEIGFLTAHPGRDPARPRPRSGAASSTGSRGSASPCRWQPPWRRPAPPSCSWPSRLRGRPRRVAHPVRRHLPGSAPTLDARTLETLGPERRGRYGQVRAFGSLAFVLCHARGRLPARRGGRTDAVLGRTCRSSSRPSW